MGPPFEHCPCLQRFTGADPGLCSCTNHTYISYAIALYMSNNYMSHFVFL
jgi:hypothetical protein